MLLSTLRNSYLQLFLSGINRTRVVVYVEHFLSGEVFKQTITRCSVTVRVPKQLSHLQLKCTPTSPPRRPLICNFLHPLGPKHVCASNLVCSSRPPRLILLTLRRHWIVLTHSPHARLIPFRPSEAAVHHRCLPTIGYYYHQRDVLTELWRKYLFSLYS